MGRLIAVPDIHGRKDLLLKLFDILINKEGLDLSTDKLIFLGDMVDRGPDSKGVIDFIRDLLSKHPSNVVALVGNHEDMMRRALRRGYSDFQLWMWNGGGKTLWSFGDLSQGCSPLEKNIVPNDYLDWLNDLPTFHEEPGFFFSHAPVPCDRRRKNKDIPFTREELTWTYDHDEASIARKMLPTVGVCGHIHRLGEGIFAPRYYEHYLFCDAGSGCHRDAPLVATDVQARRAIWAYPDGVSPKPQRKRKYLPLQPDLSENS